MSQLWPRLPSFNCNTKNNLWDNSTLKHASMSSLGTLFTVLFTKILFLHAHVVGMGVEGEREEQIQEKNQVDWWTKIPNRRIYESQGSGRNSHIMISACNWICPIELTRLQPELCCEWSPSHAYELAWLLWNMWWGYLRHYPTPGELQFLISCLCDLLTVLLMQIECKPQLQPWMGLSASQPMLFRAQNICNPLDHFWIISSIFMLN